MPTGVGDTAAVDLTPRPIRPAGGGRCAREATVASGSAFGAGVCAGAALKGTVGWV